MNDPELIESLTYLLVSREEKERANSRNYDGKKNCWILDQKDGFVSAEIQHSNGDVVNVRTFNGEVSLKFKKNFFLLIIINTNKITKKLN